MGEGHLAFLAFVTRASEGRCLGQGADEVADRLIDIAGMPALFALGTFGFQRADFAVAPFGQILVPGAVMGGAVGLNSLTPGQT